MPFGALVEDMMRILCNIVEKPIVISIAHFRLVIAVDHRHIAGITHPVAAICLQKLRVPSLFPPCPASLPLPSLHSPPWAPQSNSSLL